MLPKWHILIGFAVAYLLTYFFNFSLIAGFIIFLSSFLLDFDHYLLYVYKTRNFSLRKAYNQAITDGKKWGKLLVQQKSQYKLKIFLFHGIEFFIILIALSQFSIFFLWVLIGFLIHMAADIPDLIYKKFPVYAKLSQIVVWQTNKSKKKLK